MEGNKTTSLHCTELVTGKNLTGLLTLAADRIRVNIYSYDDLFSIDPEHPIFLLTEKNDIVSLHSNVGSRPGRSSRLIAPVRTIHRQDIISNIAIIGHDPWTVDDRVKRVTFTVKHTNELLMHKGKFANVGRRETMQQDAWLILRDWAAGMRIEARYAAVYEMGFDAPQKVWPSFGIEFDDPPTIHEYVRHVSDYVRFLSFCLGVPLTPSEFCINRLSLHDVITAMEAEVYPGDHRVHYVWPEAEIESRDLWVGGSPVRAWDDQELAAFRGSLVIWMTRAMTWSKAYALMMESFAKKKEISAERLVSACRWFEEIPLTKARQAISDADIDAISAAAIEAADSRGLAMDIRRRVAGAIKWIKAETAEEQFWRLVKLVQEKFGPDCLPDSAVPHLKQAIAFRGKTAHGHFEPKDEAEFRAFLKSITALEALCMLLMAFDLPINTEGIARMRFNPVIRDYRQS